ncbi:Oidioi.mRNA.OKI2018_I69.XSR.g15395.t1.cds [Oikopleura dioica]|uniref:Oidioi.mRNA.OKI2018_I69.XSR.g15395.t1.cds n=1 Tax=Oikopleura dioica TaxID=34765 RepID=A0ABN7SDA3_OIKDI|nr:Oidioi.mRNA.OKI2018_I69.XSR.g15395.t1.cds [Oikopleura dioica]
MVPDYVFSSAREIGRGATSRVYLAETRGSGDLVAVKEVGLSKKIEKQSIFREIEVMRGFNHKNVLKCLSFDASEDKIQIILEYCPLGSLADLILRTRESKSSLVEKEVCNFGRQITSALKYIHDLKVLHRDLKPDNIMITAGSLLKICDFGVCRVLQEGESKAKTFVGTIQYCAPELLKNSTFGPAGDIWGLGTILVELATLAKPFGESEAFLAICNRISKGSFRPLPDTFSTEFKTTVLKILQVDPIERPTTEELLECSLFTEDNEDVEEYYEEDFDDSSSLSEISDKYDDSRSSTSIDSYCSSFESNSFAS